MSDRRFAVEESTDQEWNERVGQRHAQAEANLRWLQDHWGDLLPQALGQFVAVAGQEAFIAADPTEARARAVAAHPADEGVILQYVRPEKGPRIYANRRDLAPVR
jgi:hypothetical protein